MKGLWAYRSIFGVLLVVVLLTPGCATLTRPKMQRIPVTSDPIGAVVKVDGQSQGVTPVIIKLARKKGDHVIRIESPGYNPVEIRPQRKVVGLTCLNYLFGIPVGWIVGGVIAFNKAAVRNHNESLVGFILISAGTALGVGGLLIYADKSNGSGYKMTPENIDVTLIRAQGPPRVQTVLVDAGALRNIKWIRVRRN